MFRALVLSSIALLALIPSAAAKPDLPLDVFECDGSVCVVVRNDQYGTCAGVGVGLQGAVVCKRPSGCVSIHAGFNDLGTCGLILP